MIIERDTRYVALAGAFAWHQQGKWALRNAEKEYGVKVYRWSEEDIKKITKLCVDNIYPEWADKSAYAAQAVDIILQQMKDQGRID